MNTEDIDYIVVHCSASPLSWGWTTESIRDYHVNRRGWRDIGYHFVIERDGKIQGGRPMMEQGAHVYGYNDRAWGVCLIGGVEEDRTPVDNYTPEQKTALASLIRSLHGSRPSAEVLGHRDLSPDANGDGEVTREEWLKACPCFDVREWWRQLV